MDDKMKAEKCHEVGCQGVCFNVCHACSKHICLKHSFDGLCHECFVKKSAVPENILEEATRIVDGPRQDDYGHPKHSYGQIGRAWGVILGYEVSAREVCLCLITMKIMRDLHKPKRDNLVDIAGYARVIEMIEED